MDWPVFGQIAFFLLGFLCGLFPVIQFRRSLAPTNSGLCEDYAVAAASSTAAAAVPIHITSTPVRRHQPEPTWVPVAEHAAALVEWLRDAGLVEVAAKDAADMYGEMCVDKFWAIRPWNSVAVELRKLSGGEKSYAWRGKDRVRVYRIAPRSAAHQHQPQRHAA